MERYGDLFPDRPRNLEELVDSLVSRMAAAERLLRSLTPEQREELAGLMARSPELYRAELTRLVRRHTGGETTAAASVVSDAAAALRGRKHRAEKPFAVLVADLAAEILSSRDDLEEQRAKCQ